MICFKWRKKNLTITQQLRNLHKTVYENMHLHRACSMSANGYGRTIHYRSQQWVCESRNSIVLALGWRSTCQSLQLSKFILPLLTVMKWHRSTAVFLWIKKEPSIRAFSGGEKNYMVDWEKHVDADSDYITTLICFVWENDLTLNSNKNWFPALFSFSKSDFHQECKIYFNSHHGTHSVLIWIYFERGYTFQRVVTN